MPDRKTPKKKPMAKPVPPTKAPKADLVEAPKPTPAPKEPMTADTLGIPLPFGGSRKDIHVRTTGPAEIMQTYHTASPGTDADVPPVLASPPEVAAPQPPPPPPVPTTVAAVPVAKPAPAPARRAMKGCDAISGAAIPECYVDWNDTMQTVTGQLFRVYGPDNQPMGYGKIQGGFVYLYTNARPL